jgi:hypothetical protein
MTLLTPGDIARGALKRGTPAFDEHFPKLPEQHPPALIPGSPKKVAIRMDAPSTIPTAPSVDASEGPILLMRRGPPPLLPPPMPKASASSSSPVVVQALPELDVEARFALAISQKAGSEGLNALAVAAAREIRTRDESQWAPLLVRCTKGLAHCARMISEGQSVTWNGQRAGADVIFAKKVQTVLNARPTDNEIGRAQLGSLFGFVIGEQVFNEGNNRGAYFLVSMLSEFHKIPLPAQEKFMARDKDSASFFQKKIAAQFEAMYK